MVSEVRKVLDSYSFFEIPLWLTRLDVAERADAAKREEPVQELRQAVKHFIDKWLSSATKEHQYLSQIIYVMTDELNAIIATKPDPVENRQATASGDDPWRVTGVTPTKDGGSIVSFSYQKTGTSKPVLDGSTFHGPDEYMVTYQCPKCKKTGRCTNKSCPENCSCGHRFGESPKATASGPVMHESVWCDGRNITPATEQAHDMKPVTVQQVREIVAEKISEMVDSLTFIQEWKDDWKKEEQVDQWREIKPVIEPAVAEKVYEIAAKAVRDAMPDVLDGLAKTWDDCGYLGGAKAFRDHAAKLRKERGK